MLVAVKNVVEIPYVVKLGPVEYSFAPQTEVPDELAKKIIANQPELFFAVGEQVLDVSVYTVQDVFQGKTVEEIFKSLPEKERLEVYAFLKKKAQEVQKRDLKKKNAEVIAAKTVGPDEVQTALGLGDVPKEKLDEAVNGSSKPEIRKVK